MRYLILALSLMLLTACEGNTAARKAARGDDYVSAPDRIYFKNTRLRNYAADERREDVTIYRHDDLWESESVLLPAIVDHWLEDRADLRFEVRTGPNDEALPRPFRLDLNRSTGWETLALTVPPTVEELTRLRSHLATQQDLRIVMGLDTLNPFLGEARADAKTVLDDYLRLVGEK